MKQTEINFYELLKRCKPHLTKQQYRTIKGQAKKGDIIAAFKGLNTILSRNISQGELKP